MWRKGKVRNHNTCTSSHKHIKQSCNGGDCASSEKDPGNVESVYLWMHICSHGRGKCLIKAKSISELKP